MAVVRNHNQHALILIEKILQPMDRIEIQMVRRFVEQQRLRMPKQRLRQQHAHLLPARNLRHFPLVHLVGNVEPLQQNRRVRFGRIAVFLADNAFQFAEFHPVGVGHLMLRVNEFPLFESRPQPLVPHDHRVDHAILIERELVLAQHAELPRTHHRSLLRLQFARQKLHERGFPRAIRPGQPVAFPRNKARGYFVKQNFSAVAHGNIAN